MIWQAWVMLALIGTVWSYFAFVAKRAAVWSGAATFGFYAVASLGALELQTKFATTTEVGVAVLFALGAIVGAIVSVAAFTGQYGANQDDADRPGAGQLRDQMSENA